MNYLKKKYENQIKDLKNELSFIKIKKNQEKNFKNKLTIKEKEINELKTILNTNASIKSQLSSIYKEPKEEEIINKGEQELLIKEKELNKNMSLLEKEEKNMTEKETESFNKDKDSE